MIKRSQLISALLLIALIPCPAVVADVHRLSALELIDQCQSKLSRSAQPGLSTCSLYIQGFLDGSYANHTADKTARSAYVERATQNRAGGLIDRLDIQTVESVCLLQHLSVAKLQKLIADTDSGTVPETDAGTLIEQVVQQQFACQLP